MNREGHPVTRAQFEQNLHDKETDPAFLSDIEPLLRPDLSYDVAAAIVVVRESLVELLPGDPWRGTSAEKLAKKRRREKSQYTSISIREQRCALNREQNSPAERWKRMPFRRTLPASEPVGSKSFRCFGGRHRSVLATYGPLPNSARYRGFRQFREGVD